MKIGKGIIHFPKGTAFVVKGNKKENVESIETQSCDCGMDYCDCGLILTDLSTGDKYVIFMLDGVLSQATYADFVTFKESQDTDDLNATVYTQGS